MKKELFFSFLTNLITKTDSDVQLYDNRIHYHQIGKKRNFNDIQIWTHIFFIIAAISAYFNKIYELFVLMSLTTIFSTLYHFDYEKPGIISKIESFFAKLLFIYGTVQLFFTPCLFIFIVEIFLFLFTVLVFIGTNYKCYLYDPWHCLMHIIPPIWCIIVSYNHKKLLF